MDKPAAPATGIEKWKRVALGMWAIFTLQDTHLRCAGTAFFGFLSFFPAIASGVLIYGLATDQTVIAANVEFLQYLVPTIAIEVLIAQLEALADQPPVALGLGLLVSVPLTLWSLSRGVDALLFAMASVRQEKPRRGFLMAMLITVGVSLFGAVFLLAALVTVAGLPALIPFPTGGELLVLVMRWPVLLVLTVLVLSALYRWGPDRHPRRWRYIWPGAILASLLWLGAGALFSIYVENFGNFEAIFGSLTAAVVLLLWMYNSAQIFVLGAAFNAELEYASEGRPRLAPTAAA